MIIKVISLNMWGGQLLTAALEFLQTQAADVVLLQEVHNGHDPALEAKYRSLDVLHDQLAYPHHAFAHMYTVNRPPGPVALGTVVLSRFPIQEQAAKFLVEPDREVYDDVSEQWPIFPRLLQYCRLQTPAGEVNVFNIHGVWDLDGDNFSDARQRMSQIITASIANKANVILGGDTNAKPTNPAMRALEQQLKPVFGNDLVSTFNMRRKDNPGYATAAVDLMYVSPSIKIASKAVPDVDISDHLPLIVELEIA